MLGFKCGLAELVQPGTTSASQAEGRGFKSRTPHLIFTKNVIDEYDSSYKFWHYVPLEYGFSKVRVLCLILL